MSSNSREYSHRWYEEHKDRWKEYRRKFDEQYQAEHGVSYQTARYHERKSKGLCVLCGLPVEEFRSGRCRCMFCEAHRRIARRRKKDLTNPGK